MGLLLSAPGGGGYTGQGLRTLDRTGTVGYNDGTNSNNYTDDDYNKDFSGTSASCPVVSAVAALMLEANPDLGWRDVKNIFAMSSTLTGSAAGFNSGSETFDFQINGAANWNGGGLHFSGDYGYGNVNAHAAVALAETWFLPGGTALTSTHDLQVKSYSDSTDKVITVGTNNSSVSYTFAVSAADSISIEHLDVFVDWADVDAARDFKITLTDPDGKQYIIMDPSRNVFNADVYQTNGQMFLIEIYDHTLESQWIYGVEAFRGMLSEGNWTVTVEDTNHYDAQLGMTTNTSTIKEVGLEFSGTTISTDDVYYYTDEFMTMVKHGTLGSSNRETLTDTNGGTDTINASAVSIDLTLSGARGAVNTLTDGINSANITIGSTTDIENLISGSGNDTLTGNDLDNKIWGRYGNDSINGGLGNDTLDGGHGNDTLTGGAGADIFVFGNLAGSDSITDYVVGTDNVRLEGTGIKAEELYDNLSISGGNAVYTDGQISITFTGITSLVGLADDFVLA